MMFWAPRPNFFIWGQIRGWIWLEILKRISITAYIFSASLLSVFFYIWWAAILEKHWHHFEDTEENKLIYTGWYARE